MIFLSISLSLASAAQGIYDESDIGLQRLFIDANKYKLLSKYDKAIDIYEKIIEQDPVNGPAYYDLARVQLALEEYDQATKAIKKAISFDRLNIWYLLTSVDIFDQADRCSEYVGALKTLVQIKDDYDLYVRLFEAQMKCGDARTALLTIGRIESLFGQDVSWLDRKVDVLLGLNQGKEALKRVQEYVNRNPKDINGLERLANMFFVLDKSKKGKEVLDQIISVDPYNDYAIYQLGNLESQNGSKDNSIITLVKDPRFDLDDKIKFLLPIVQSVNDQAVISDLISGADFLTANYSDEAKSHALRGDIRMIVGDTEEAISSYTKTLELDKSNFAVWDQLLYAYMISSEFQSLLNTSEQAMDYYPNQSAPYLYKAVALYEIGEPDEALDHLEEFRFITSDEAILNDISYLIESKIAKDSGKLAEAITVLQNYIDSNSVVNPNIYDYLGDLYIDSGDKDKALKSWQRSMELGGIKEDLKAKIESI